MQKQRPPRGAGVPPNQEFPPLTRTLNFVLLRSHYLPSTQHTDKKHKETHSRRRLGEASNSSMLEIEKIFRNDACQFEPFRLGVRRSKIDGSLSIDYRRNCLAGDKPLRQFLLGLTSKNNINGKKHVFYTGRIKIKLLKGVKGKKQKSKHLTGFEPTPPS